MKTIFSKIPYFHNLPSSHRGRGENRFSPRPSVMAVAAISMRGFVAILAAHSLIIGINAEDTSELSVNIEDIRGLIDLEAELIREELIEPAFYEAAKRKKWLGDYSLTYNEQLPKNPRNRLEIRLFDWSRNRANFFEFAGSAIYYDSDGKPLNLGMIHGIRSGIDVTMRHDFGEHFADAAEDAFDEALRKLKKLYSQVDSNQ